MTHFLAKTYFSLIRVLKSKIKKLTLTFLYCLGQETWLDISWNLIYISQSRFYNFFHVAKFKIFNITSKYFSIFNNRPPASWVAHITKDFLRFYSCSYYKSLFSVKAFSTFSEVYPATGHVEKNVWKFWETHTIDSHNCAIELYSFATVFKLFNFDIV